MDNELFQMGDIRHKLEMCGLVTFLFILLFFFYPRRQKENCYSWLHVSKGIRQWKLSKIHKDDECVSSELLRRDCGKQLFKNQLLKAIKMWPREQGKKKLNVLRHDFHGLKTFLMTLIFFKGRSIFYWYEGKIIFH